MYGGLKVVLAILNRENSNQMQILEEMSILFENLSSPPSCIE